MNAAEKFREHLTALSRNLWWSWNPHIIKLFRDIDVEAFRACNHNPVPVIVTYPGLTLRENGGILADVTPTLLQMLGIEQPAGMTGHTLIES